MTVPRCFSIIFFSNCNPNEQDGEKEKWRERGGGKEEERRREGGREEEGGREVRK